MLSSHLRYEWHRHVTDCHDDHHHDLFQFICSFRVIVLLFGVRSLVYGALKNLTALEPTDTITACWVKTQKYLTFLSFVVFCVCAVSVYICVFAYSCSWIAGCALLNLCVNKYNGVIIIIIIIIITISLCFSYPCWLCNWHLCCWTSMLINQH